MTDIKPYPLRARDQNGKEYCPGWIWQGHIFRKTPRLKDMLKSPPAWTISTEVFEMLPRYGVDVIQMKVKETGELYVTSMRTFKENCVPGGVDRKNGRNAALALSFWRIVPNG